MESKKTFKKKHIIFLVIFFLCLGFAKLWQYHWSDAVISLAGENLHVLVAKNNYQQYRGLGKRDSLDGYDGMLFLYSSERQHAIVMREMRFDIDIIWLNRGVVVDFAPNVLIEPNVPNANLLRYQPRTNANMVLEVPAGWVDKVGLKIGDRLELIKE